VNTSVPNPFYNLLPATQMPGQLRTQSSVAVSQLPRPYPQYSDLWEALIGGRGGSLTKARALSRTATRAPSSFVTACL
jgi:hypothetical protein